MSVGTGAVPTSSWICLPTKVIQHLCFVLMAAGAENNVHPVPCFFQMRKSHDTAVAAALMAADETYVPALAWSSASCWGNFCLSISATTSARSAAWIPPPGPKSAS
eukprot:813564-Pyramimonas_sp.AAC.1